MRILHIMWNMDIGGAERAVYQLIREQRNTGFDSNVLVLNNLGYYGNLVKVTGAEVVCLHMKKSFDRSIKDKFVNILINCDIVHFHSAEPYPMYLSSKNKEIKKYYTHRGGVFKYNFFKGLRYKYCGYLIKNKFTGLSGNTREGARAASLLFNIPIEKVDVTYNGLDFSLLNPLRSRETVFSKLSLNKDNIIVGTSGNLKKWKRIDMLIRCVAKVENKNVKCIIIGDGAERKNLENIAINLNIKDKIIFTGKTVTVSDYLQILDIFVLPSESLESFGNSAVEAIATGIPTIVMSDGGGLVEHIVNNKTGIIANDENDLIDKINSLIGDKLLRENIGRAGKQYIREKYSLKKMIENYNKLYKLN